MQPAELPDIIFHYPKNMIKKIFEIDYMRKRKLLLVLEECIDA